MLIVLPDTVATDVFDDEKLTGSPEDDAAVIRKGALPNILAGTASNVID